jgi:hypothetical protein
LISTKENQADALSRYPVDKASPEDELDEMDAYQAEINNVIYEDGAIDDDGVPLSKIADLRLTELKMHAEKDANYMKLSHALCKGILERPEKCDEWLRQFCRYESDLHIDDDGFICYNGRLFIPESLRPVITQRLMNLHQGLEKTKKQARSSVWWPAMNNQLKVASQSCETCTRRLPSNPPEPPRQHAPATYPL